MRARGPKKLGKTTISACWRLQNQFKEATEYRDGLKRNRVPVDKAWEAALEKYPVQKAALDEVMRLRKQKLKSLSAADPTKEEIDKHAEELYKKAKRAEQAEARTGIAVFDWVYANLEHLVPCTPEPAQGDMEFFQWCREHRQEFYTKYYLPALMKQKGVGGAAEPSAPLEASDQKTQSLLEILGAK